MMEHQKVVVRVCARIRPEALDEALPLMKGMGDAAASFAGHLGGELLQPLGAGPGEYRILYQFDNPTNLQVWLDSEQRERWLKWLEPLLAQPPKVERLTGLESSLSAGATLPRWKMVTLATVASLLPAAILAELVILPFPELPMWLRGMFVGAIMTPMVALGLMPFLTKWFRDWLK